MKRWTCKLLLAVMLCCLFAVFVSAAKPGSLLLTKVRKPAMVFRVADADGAPTEDFVGVVDQLTQTDLTPEVAKKFFQHVQNGNLLGETGTPNENNEIFFPSLTDGWYLVCSMAEEAEFAPFLICMPMTIGEGLVYDIQAEPKVETPVEPSVPSEPVTPQPNIPQTGAILWPQYLLLSLGAVAICAGLVEVYRGREKNYE